MQRTVGRPVLRIGRSVKKVRAYFPGFSPRLFVQGSDRWTKGVFPVGQGLASFSRTSNCPCYESLKPHRENPGENTWRSPVLAGLDFSGSYVDLSGIEKLQREGQGSR